MHLRALITSLAIGPEAAADEWSRTLPNQESSAAMKRCITSGQVLTHRKNSRAAATLQVNGQRLVRWRRLRDDGFHPLPTRTFKRCGKKLVM